MVMTMVMNPTVYGPWTPEEEAILKREYPRGGARPVVEALASCGYWRSLGAVRIRAVRLGVKHVGPAGKLIADGRFYAASTAVQRRPLTPTSIEIIHWYAARGCSPRKTARDINRPVEVVEQVLREVPAPAMDRDSHWPQMAGWGLG